MWFYLWVIDAVLLIVSIVCLLIVMIGAVVFGEFFIPLMFIFVIISGVSVFFYLIIDELDS